MHRIIRLSKRSVAAIQKRLSRKSQPILSSEELEGLVPTPFIYCDCQPAGDHRLQRLPRRLSDRIPLEIIWRVIDWLVNDGDSLLKCALISRSCLEYCMEHLYTDIVILRRETFSKLVRSGFEHAAVRKRLTQTQSLLLQGESSIASEDESDHPWSVMSVGIISPGAVSMLCPSLECIAFRDCTAAPLHHTFFRALRLCQSVTELSLVGVKFFDSYDLQRVISVIPRLRKLGIERIWYLRHEREIASAPQWRLSSHKPSKALPRLEHLRIGPNLPDDVLAELIDWLVDASACESVSTLEVWQADGYIPVANKLLEAVGPFLLHLHENSKATAPTHPHMDLRHNINLRYLHSYIEPFEEAPGQTTLLPFLSSIRSKHLEEIRLSTCYGLLFSTSFEARVAESLPDPKRLAILERPVFSALKSVVVDVKLGWYAQREDLFISKMKEMLLPWHVRGILKFERTVGLF